MSFELGSPGAQPMIKKVGESLSLGWLQDTLRFELVYRLVTISRGTFLRGVQGNPNKFPILVQGDAVHGIPSN